MPNLPNRWEIWRSTVIRILGKGGKTVEAPIRSRAESLCGALPTPDSARVAASRCRPREDVTHWRPTWVARRIGGGWLRLGNGKGRRHAKGKEATASSVWSAKRVRPPAQRQSTARARQSPLIRQNHRPRRALSSCEPHPVHHHGKSVERAGRGGTAPAPLPCPSDGPVGRHRCDLLGYLARPAPTALQGGQLRRHDDSSVGSYCCHTCSGYVHRMIIIMCASTIFSPLC